MVFRKVTVFFLGIFWDSHSKVIGGSRRRQLPFKWDIRHSEVMLIYIPVIGQYQLIRSMKCSDMYIRYMKVVN
jgi:hypothetical protein